MFHWFFFPARTPKQPFLLSLAFVFAFIQPPLQIS